MKANKVRMILAGMMAAGMALSAAPAMAEETEVQTEAAAETEIQSEEAATVAEPVSDVIFCERKEWIGIEERSSA